MPSELQQNRYDQLIRRVGGIVGPGSKVSEALTELFPTIDVENVPLELQVLGATHAAFGGAGTTPEPGKFSYIQLFNPVDSGKLITVTRVVFAMTQTNIAKIAVETVIRGAEVLSERFADTRLTTTAAPTGKLFFLVDAAVPVNIGRINTTDTNSFDLFDDRGVFVLAPGTGLTVAAEQANVGIDVSFWWRERVAEQSELNF